MAQGLGLRGYSSGVRVGIWKRLAFWRDDEAARPEIVHLVLGLGVRGLGLGFEFRV